MRDEAVELLLLKELEWVGRVRVRKQSGKFGALMTDRLGMKLMEEEKEELRIHNGAFDTSKGIFSASVSASVLTCFFISSSKSLSRLLPDSAENSKITVTNRKNRKPFHSNK